MEEWESDLPELPADVWDEIGSYLDQAETLATLADVSHAIQDWVKARPGLWLVFDQDQLKGALADPKAKYIILMQAGLTVDAAPVNPLTLLITRRSRMTVTGGVLYLAGSEASATVTSKGRVVASDGATITEVTNNGVATARDGGIIIDVTGGTAIAFDGGIITNVTGGLVRVGDGGTVTATGGKIHVRGSNATVNAGPDVVIVEDEY